MNTSTTDAPPQDTCNATNSWLHESQERVLACHFEFVSHCDVHPHFRFSDEAIKRQMVFRKWERTQGRSSKEEGDNMRKENVSHH